MTRWPLPWPKVRPSHLYLGTQNNSPFLLLFFIVIIIFSPAAPDVPWSGGWMWGEGSKLAAPLLRSGSSPKGGFGKSPAPAWIGLHPQAKQHRDHLQGIHLLPK